MSQTEAQQEKRSAAFNSVLAALGLTGMKVVVGVATNSLGILAEALHSFLDLAAAAVTYFAVRVSDKPADAEHLFGHGKVENLSALFETVLLLVTSAWILHEGYVRLFVHSVEVDPSAWAFLVMGISIIVDFGRSRMLYRVARKHNSQALEADALHFATDIWSSGVVILGLVGVWVAQAKPEMGWLVRADALAAVVVALIVVFVSCELGWRTLKALLDTAPAGVAEQVTREVESVEGVLDCHRVRVRPSGPHFFVDFHVTMDGGQTLESAHALVEVVEARVRRLLPGSDVTVHVDPTSAVPWLRDPPPEQKDEGASASESLRMESPMPEPTERTEEE
jgi:cation diffusion facilitator family transporter